ncbi:MAG: helix-turn-helix transcriptional regulator [Oscillibacter sp.]|nr:helix-turn-helix transcriptional regulator [Oscillospiraceae bacterium]MCI8810829.1 helix-turn-helix transcriptional regulator [Oscillibacter sp.]
MQFQDRLYQLRKEKGLSQENLADILGITRQAVQKWESGASRPDMENLVALAQYFGVTLDWLITGVDTAHPEAPVQQTIVNNYYHRWHYEYRSKRTLFGLPLVHINLMDNGLCRAKGILAIGNVSIGVVSLGTFSFGVVSLGAIAIGAFSLGALALGLLAIGAAAGGLGAVGGLAWGALALGGIAEGIYAVGDIASAAEIAIGEIATGPLAIGDQVDGAVTLLTDGSVSLAVIQEAIEQAASGAPQWLRDFLVTMARHIHSVPLS